MYVHKKYVHVYIYEPYTCICICGHIPTHVCIPDSGIGLFIFVVWLLAVLLKAVSDWLVVSVLSADWLVVI